MTRIVTVLAVFAFTFIAPLEVQAQCGQPSYVTHYNHHAERVIVKEVIQTVAVPFVVPATVFQYMPALQPQVAPVAVQPVQSTVPQAAQQPDVDALIRARVDQILREKMGNGDSGPPTLILNGDP